MHFLFCFVTFQLIYTVLLLSFIPRINKVLIIIINKVLIIIINEVLIIIINKVLIIIINEVLIIIISRGAQMVFLVEYFNSILPIIVGHLSRVFTTKPLFN